MINKLPIDLFIATTAHLSLRDLVNLSSTCSSLHHQIFTLPGVWQGRRLFSETGLITDNVIQNLVHKIPRDYNAIRELWLDYLPLSTKSLLLIFNQFAHCVHHFDLNIHDAQLIDLCTHLEAFAFSLAQSQISLQIPLTFGNYVCDARTYMAHIEDAVIRIGPSGRFRPEDDWAGFLRALSLPSCLDDPPFEQLESFGLQSVLFVAQTERFDIGTDRPGDRHLLCRFQDLVGFLSNRQFGHQKRNCNRMGSSEMGYCTTKRTKFKQAKLDTPKVLCENKKTDISSPANHNRTHEKAIRSIPKQAGICPSQPIVRVMRLWPSQKPRPNDPSSACLTVQQSQLPGLSH
ncbi:hypothetical protein CLU79DRAFT_88383 [Phycomyces nitens]|nr:hypothetical protein CLU79DRAFT_88383 [Phycomyces nitens]